MSKTALVVGTGWAGEGHVLGLRCAGVEVKALCGRTKSAVEKRADEFGISMTYDNWSEAIKAEGPDIVSIATTAPPHRDIAIAAAAAGAHVICEKPLGVSAAEAKEMYDAVEQTGVKHGYAASRYLEPKYTFMRSLIADGLIGEVTDMELHQASRLLLNLPFSWAHLTSEGGGMLNTMFTHDVYAYKAVFEAGVESACGFTINMTDPVPVGKQFHDIRELLRTGMNELEPGEFRKADTDYAFAVKVLYGLTDGKTVSASFISTRGTLPIANFEAVTGTKGTLYVEGRGTEIRHYDNESGEWDTLNIPNDLIESREGIHPAQANWNEFFSRFVESVEGKGNRIYPTFRDGWITCEVIDAVRESRSWKAGR